jgi:hypothetical protein
VVWEDGGGNPASYPIAQFCTHLKNLKNYSDLSQKCFSGNRFRRQLPRERDLTPELREQEQHLRQQIATNQ